MACHLPKHCACPQQGLEERLLQSLDQRLADLKTMGAESPADDSSLSVAAAVSIMLTGDSAVAFEPSMASTQSMQQQQQQGEEEDGGRQAAYERMLVSF